MDSAKVEEVGDFAGRGLNTRIEIILPNLRKIFIH